MSKEKIDKESSSPKPTKAKKSTKASEAKKESGEALKATDPSETFEKGDRVKRKAFTGPLGTVQSVRTEVALASLKNSKERPTETVTVLWDNGTLSHFIPEGLERP